ncbi:MAG: sortase [Acutalibacteraceae bacterium]|jgi:sortase A
MRKRGIVAMILGLIMILGALGLSLYNAREESEAYAASEEILPELEKSIIELKADYSKKTVVMEDGNEYIGILDIPSQGIRLPVLSSWSYPLLKIAPCRYSGYFDDEAFVIAGHNYARHFANLGKLVEGDKIYFTDVTGVKFAHTVKGVEILGRTQVEEMKNEDWDLTVFTCDYRGRMRVTVRCTRDAIQND